MVDRSEPSATSAPKGSISASPDDTAGRRRGGGARRRGEGGSGSSLGVYLILTVLVAGLMVAGWFIAEQHQQLQAGVDALASAEERIVVLEDRLRVTDEALTETGEHTSEQINFWESEIRKLWAVTNERNRKWIEDNRAAIAEAKKTLTSLEASAREIQGTLGRHETAFERQEEVVDLMTAMEVQLQQLARSQRDLVDRTNAAQQSVASLQSGLTNRVKETEQAVTAIDAYRLQLNGRLAELERRVNSMASASTF